MRKLVVALFFSTALSLPAMAAETGSVDRGITQVAAATTEDFSAVPQSEEQLLIVPIYELPDRYEHAIEIRAPQGDFFGTVWRKVATDVPAAHQKIEDKAIYLRANFVPHRLRRLDVRFNRT